MEFTIEELSVLMRTFLRILQFGRPYTWIIPQYLFSTVLHAIFSVINISILIPVFQILFEEESTRKSIDQLPDFQVSLAYFETLFYYHFGSIIESNGKISALYFICGVVICSFLLSNLFGFAASIITSKVRIRVISNMRSEVFKRVSKFDLSYFTTSRKGDVMSRITTDIQQVEASVVGALKVLIKEPLLIIGYFTVLFRMSVELTLYTLAIIPLSGGAISYLTKKLKRRAQLSQDSLSKMTSILDEVISGIRIVKAFAAQSYIVSKFDEEIRRYARHNYKMSVKQSLAHPVSEFLGVTFMSLVLIIGGTMVLKEDSELTGSAFVGFLLIFSQVLNPSKSISNAISNIQRGLVAGERVFELMDAHPKIENKHGAVEVNEIKTGFDLEKVSFAYDETKVLQDISFSIRRGEIIALVGPSGGGKSTIADLVPRFYDPTEGKIVLDGVDIKELELNSIRKLMGIVSQESILFNDSILKNIAFGKPEATEEEVSEAARIANAHDFIIKLEQGYHTLIGERGMKLSGGQRQRISIARAILKNPPFLILDEATSALDSQSEHLVQEAIFNLMKNRTTLVIAHRLSTIKSANEILVIENGRIPERGDHEALLSKNGLYKKLFDMQSFD